MANKVNSKSNLKPKSKSKARLSPVKLGSRVEISPVTAILIIIVMIAVGYLLVSLSFASGPGSTYNPASKGGPQSCSTTTGHVWIGQTSDPGGQTECMNGTTVAAGPGGGTYNPATKNQPQSCSTTTGHVWIGQTSDPGGQTECMNGTTATAPAQKR